LVDSATEVLLFIFDDSARFSGRRDGRVNKTATLKWLHYFVSQEKKKNMPLN